MTGKSKHWKNKGTHCSSNSSDSAADDPDFVVRLSSSFLEQRSFSFSGDQQSMISTHDITEAESSSVTKRKRGCYSKRKEGTHTTKMPQKPPGERKRASSNARSSGNKNGRKNWKATILSWLIESKTLEENARVFLIDSNGHSLKEGIMRKEGILCGCCNRFFTALNFQAHAGMKPGKPYEKIFTGENCFSLLFYMSEAWNRSEEYERRKFNTIETKGSASDSYDDACVICANGGILMCCDACCSTYHFRCMGMRAIPQDSWYCPYCVCKFCGNPAQESDYLIKCSQCIKRYHWECYQGNETRTIDLNDPCAPFCEQSCREVYEKLEKMVGVQNKIDDEYSWTLLQQINQDSADYGSYRVTECHSKLAVAWRAMNECFEQIIDRHTTIDMIQSVVYSCGSNFNRINFKSFYTAVLEKEDEIISVATVRIHGTKLAEMPFIATREVHRRKGMCGKLLTGIESTLCYLKVENLVIPSIKQRVGSWQRYGFNSLEPTLKKDLRRFNTLMFHGSSRLQKTMHENTDRAITRAGLVREVEAEAEQSDGGNSPRFINKSSRSLLDLNLDYVGEESS